MLKSVKYYRHSINILLSFAMIDCCTARPRRALEYCFVSSGLPNTIRWTNNLNIFIGNLAKAGSASTESKKLDNCRLTTSTEIPAFAKLLFYGFKLIKIGGWGWG